MTAEVSPFTFLQQAVPKAFYDEVSLFYVMEQLHNSSLKGDLVSVCRDMFVLSFTVVLSK